MARKRKKEMWERDVETSSQDPVKRHVGSKEVNKLVDWKNECDIMIWETDM